MRLYKASIVGVAFAVTASVACALPAAAEPRSPPSTRKDLLGPQHELSDQSQSKFQQNLTVSRLFEELGLSSQQRATCLGLVKNGWERGMDLRNQARGAWHDLMGVLRRKDVSLDEALALQRQLAKYQALLAEKRLETWFSVRRVLTDEQLEKLSSLRIDSTLILEDGDGEPRSTKSRRNDLP